MVLNWLLTAWPCAVHRFLTIIHNKSICFCYNNIYMEMFQWEVFFYIFVTLMWPISNHHNRYSVTVFSTYLVVFDHRFHLFLFLLFTRSCYKLIGHVFALRFYLDFGIYFKRKKTSVIFEGLLRWTVFGSHMQREMLFFRGYLWRDM